MSFRITKVYTKTGDKGDTRLGNGQKVSKDNSRIQAYSAVDELNSVLGIVLSFVPAKETAKALQKIQHELFILGSDLCIPDGDKGKYPVDSIEEKHVESLEILIDKINSNLNPLEEFILPGGVKTASFLHQARCVCRRAETLIVKLSKTEKISAYNIKYINRLSDALFVLARYENRETGNEEIYWKKEM